MSYIYVSIYLYLSIYLSIYMYVEAEIPQLHTNNFTHIPENFICNEALAFHLATILRQNSDINTETDHKP